MKASLFYFQQSKGIINIFIMIEFDLEVQINELLTTFLQNFKTIFAAKMNLIESICANSHCLQSNPQFLLSKLSTKVFKFQWSIDPYGINITQEIISNIQRFYLRIQEYLEFRMNTLLSLQDKAFNKQTELFNKNLQKIIISLENNPALTASVGDLLFQFSKAEISFTSKLLQLIQTKKHSLTRGPLDYESLHDIKLFIEERICKDQLSMFKEIKRSSPNIPPPRDKKHSLQSKDEQNKLKYLIRKKVSSKPSQPRNLINPLKIQYQNNWQQKVNLHQDQIGDLQTYVQKQNKVKIHKAYDILDVDTNCKITASKEQILAELQTKNIKNKTMIEGFLFKYEKKQRRLLKRQKSQRQSKSTVKSTKLSSKNEEPNLFSMKLEKSQCQYVSYLKTNHQNSKKYEEFELPLILTRNNRRTTVQK